MNQLKYKIVSSASFLMLIFSVYLASNSAEASVTANKLLAQTRAATAKYHDVTVAEAAGYVGEGEPCVPGMGYHYVKRPLLAPGSGVTELEPEVLLYVDTDDGGKKLVGVEYLDFAITLDPTFGGLWLGHEAPEIGFLPTRPILFDGQVFDGPMEGHAPRMPWHYDLHVWIWSHNPDGTFATFNPNITCE